MSRYPRQLVYVLAAFVVSGCNWLTDFRQQPTVGPWQSLDQAGWSDTTTPYRGNPQRSVPTTGTAVAGYQVSYSPMPLAVDSLASVQNPVPATQESVDRGWKYFQVNCAVCHGEGGKGDGLVRAFFVVAPDLTLPLTQARTDGYLWGMMRNGRGLMPSLNRVDEQDRWHIVNYIRGLQGRLAADVVIRREPVGLPGVTGDALPGATRLGPTVPSRFVKPSYTPTGGGAEPPRPHQ